MGRLRVEVQVLRAIVGAYSEIFDRLDRELWLITARASEQSSGLIATYVSKVSLVPDLPRVTIAIAKHHFTHELIEASNAFAMHLIGKDQIDWVWRFGIPSGRDVDKLAGVAASAGASGAPILTDALAWLDCRVEARMDTGDRIVYLAEVIDARCRMRDEGDRVGRPAVGAGAGSGFDKLSPRTTWKPLTFKRLLEVAPAEQLKELKHSMERDIELDRAAILDWRQHAETGK